MKTPILLTAMFAATFMHGTVLANEFDAGEPRMRSTLSRAEVLADLQIWRRSGLAELSQLEVPPQSTAEYRAATARYDALRRSPEFAALVRSIAGQRGDAVTITKLDAATR